MFPKPILLTREQISDQTWDNHISQSRQCVIYALSGYLDIVCGQWEALVWPDITDFSIVMPLPVKRKFGLCVLHQPLFCQYLGIFSKYSLSEEQCEVFLRAMAGHFSYISFYAFNPCNFALMRGVGQFFENEVFQTHWLDLEQSYDNIYAMYSKDRKANLKRGMQTGWEIIESRDLEPLISLFVENHAWNIGKIKAEAYQILRKLGNYCLESGMGRLLYAHSHSRTWAGILLVEYGGRAIYLFNAADRAGRKGNARAMMLDGYFRANAGTQVVFDFESPQKQSIASYYAGFGAVQRDYCGVSRNALRFPFRQIQEIRKYILAKTS